MKRADMKIPTGKKSIDGVNQWTIRSCHSLFYLADVLPRRDAPSLPNALVQIMMGGEMTGKEWQSWQRLESSWFTTTPEKVASSDRDSRMKQ
jgi:hypothetical protein